MPKARRMNNDDFMQAAADAVRAVPQPAWGAPPATVTLLTMFGYPIADVVQAVMLVWGVGLVAGQAWKFVRWVRRRGWQEA